MISQKELKEIEPEIELAVKQACKEAGVTNPDDQDKMEKAVRSVLTGESPIYVALGIPEKTMKEFYALGNRLYKAGKYEDAIVFFIALQQKDIKNPLYSFCVAACYHQMKNYELAAGYYFGTLILNPSDPTPSFHMYDCFLKLNDINSAIGALEMVIERAQKDPRYSILQVKAEMNLRALRQLLEDKVKVI